MEQKIAYYKNLWNAASNGDVRAFSELFTDYFPKLYCFALKYTKDPYLAEDIVQQVFLRCWEKRCAIGIVDDIGAYLYRCIKNEVRDLVRRQLVHQKYQNHLASLIKEGETDTNPQSERKFQQGQEEIFTAAINHLSPQQKRVYKLSKEQGWSYAKIAQEMKVSTHTVKWHAAAAFQSLSRFLKQYENELFIFILLVSSFY